MKKQIKKDKFSSSEVGVLIDSLRSEFKPVLEAIPGIQSKLDGIFEQVGKNTEKLSLLDVLVRKNTKGIESNAEKIEINRQLITRVLEELKSKADRKDFETLEKKVSSPTT